MTLTVRLEASTETALTHFCDSQALSKSQVVHRALNDWLKAQVSGKSHALLAYVPSSVSSHVPNRVLKPAKLKSQTSAKLAGSQKTGATYVPYSKAALRVKVAGVSAGKTL